MMAIGGTSPNTQPQLFNAERPLVYLEREENSYCLNGCVMLQLDPCQSKVQLCVRVCVGGGGSRWGLLTELELSFHTGEFISLDLPVSLHTQHQHQHPPPHLPPLLLYSCCDVGQSQRGGTAKNTAGCNSCVNEHTRDFTCVCVCVLLFFFSCLCFLSHPFIRQHLFREFVVATVEWLDALRQNRWRLKLHRCLWRKDRLGARLDLIWVQ